MKAWRVWSLGTDEHGPVLTSPMDSGLQVSHGYGRSAFVFSERESWARCWARGHRKPPKRNCMCGMYSAASMDAARMWLPSNSVVAVGGKVELLGRVVTGSADVASVLAAPMIPLVGAAMRRDTSDEYRSSGVRLVGTQRLHPDYSDHVDALTKRYGVKFRVSSTLAQRVDVVAEIDEWAAQVKSGTRAWARDLIARLDRINEQ